MRDTHTTHTQQTNTPAPRAATNTNNHPKPIAAQQLSAPPRNPLRHNSIPAHAQNPLIHNGIRSITTFEFRYPSN